MADHSRLGRGLAALMGDVSEETTSSSDASRKPRRAPIENLQANPHNPRRNFAEAELKELAASIKERGIIQPIVVRPVRGKDDVFEIIAGERRWRAAQLAGLHDVPIALIEATDAQALEFAIIENVQRADLESDRGGGRLSGADGGVQSQPGRRRADRRQEPLACRQHGAAAEAVGAGEGAGALRPALGRPRAPAGRPAQRARDRAGHHQARPERAPDRNGDAQGRRARRRARSPAPRAPRTPTPRRWRKDYPTRSGLEVTVDHRGQGGTLHIKYRDLDQLDGVLRKLDRGKLFLKKKKG